MDKIEIVSINEAISAKRNVKKSKVVEEIEETINALNSGQSGKIVAKTEAPQTVKNRIWRVIKSLGMEKEITVKRTGQTIYFYKKEAE